MDALFTLSKMMDLRKCTPHIMELADITKEEWAIFAKADGQRIEKHLLGHMF